MVTDAIADYLTRIRNAQMANHKVVEVPASNLKKRITEILYNQGYILKYKFDNSSTGQGVIKMALKYDPRTKAPAIRKLERVSKPGLRKYANVSSIPRAINGLGLIILSTSQGILTDKQAVDKNVGGEVLCKIY